MKKDPLTPEQREALEVFAGSYGRFWKCELIARWLDGRDEKEPGGMYLRQIRNTHGPSILGKIAVTPRKAATALRPRRIAK
jgi:hypothetical protein